MITQKRLRRKKRVRASINGTSVRPRLSVYRSNKYIYAQVINDEKGVTIVGASGGDPKVVGDTIAKSALKKKISTVVFDRSGYRYHGRVRDLAESARKGGLKF